MPTKQYEAFIHDWDGTLAKTLPAWVESYQEAFIDWGVAPMETQDIVLHLGDLGIASYFGIDDTEKFAATVAQKVDSRLQEVVLYEGAKEYLDIALKIGRLALATNSPRVTLERGLSSSGLEGYFDVVLCVEDVKYQKPHPEVVHKALGELGVSSDNAVMIGESRKDIRAGQNANIDTVLVLHPENEVYYDIDELIKLNPTYVVQSFKELEDIVWTDR